MHRPDQRRILWFRPALILLVAVPALWFCHSLWQGERLCFAIRRGDIGALRRNLESGCSPDSICVDGPPILWATMKGREDMVAALMDYGASPENEVLLMVHKRQLGMLRLHHKRGIDLSRPRGSARERPVDVARRKGYQEIVSFLESTENPVGGE